MQKPDNDLANGVEPDALNRELSELFAEAEEFNQRGRSRASASSARLFGEIVADVTGQSVGEHFVRGGNRRTFLKVLRERGALPPEIEHDLDQIVILGNSAAHSGISSGNRNVVSSSESAQNVERLKRVAYWFAKNPNRADKAVIAVPDFVVSRENLSSIGTVRDPRAGSVVRIPRHAKRSLSWKVAIAVLVVLVLAVPAVHVLVHNFKVPRVVGLLLGIPQYPWTTFEFDQPQIYVTRSDQVPVLVGADDSTLAYSVMEPDTRFTADARAISVDRKAFLRVIDRNGKVLGYVHEELVGAGQP